VDAINACKQAGLHERFRRAEAICWPRGWCQREALENDSGQWTWCRDCLTVYDDYGVALMEIVLSATSH
jgi:hypothetical protein